MGNNRQASNAININKKIRIPVKKDYGKKRAKSTPSSKEVEKNISISLKAAQNKT